MAIEPLAIGVCSWSLRPKDMADLVAQVRSVGLEHMQLALIDLVMADDNRKAGELSHLRASGIKLTGRCLDAKSARCIGELRPRTIVQGEDQSRGRVVGRCGDRIRQATLSLLGLIRHLAKVERIWLRQRAAGQAIPPLYGGAGDDTDFAEIRAQDAEEEVAQLRDEWQQADQAVAGLPFDHAVDVHGEVMSLRMIYLHVIGEYARHNGHADLLREAIDGVTGR